jgi:hypothetical protein
VKDVEAAELEVHVLTPTRYEAPTISNECALQQNQQIAFCQPSWEVQSQEKKEMQYVQLQALQLFSKKRSSVGTAS